MKNRLWINDSSCLEYLKITCPVFLGIVLWQNDLSVFKVANNFVAATVLFVFLFSGIPKSLTLSPSCYLPLSTAKPCPATVDTHYPFFLVQNNTHNRNAFYLMENTVTEHDLLYEYPFQIPSLYGHLRLPV